MEFKLNKIDPDLRRQVNEVTKEGKVHGADHNLRVNKDPKEKHDKETFHEHMNTGKKILINAEKKESIDVEAFSEKDEITMEAKGRFLDIRK